jgi:hypothetical protein
MEIGAPNKPQGIIELACARAIIVVSLEDRRFPSMLIHFNII